MSRQAIPYQNDCTAQVPMDFAHEPNEILGPRVVIQEFVIQPQPQRPRGAGDGSDRRNAITSIPGALKGRVARRRPHTPPQRPQQVPAFIEKNQASLMLEALFLVAATRCDANERCSPRFVRGRAAPASADSSPSDAVAAAHIPDETPRRTIARSCPAPKVRSIHPVHTPNTVCPAPRQRPIRSVGGWTTWELCPDEAWTVACFPASTPSSTDAPRRRCSRLSQPLPSTTYPSRKAGPRFFDGLRASRGFLLVS
jgi:hypothetical protein